MRSRLSTRCGIENKKVVLSALIVLTLCPFVCETQQVVPGEAVGLSSSLLKKAVNDVGKVGLHNQGNTCFMNSALQCLSHTASLTDYFLENHHVAEINKTNPLGTKGELATAFGDLLRKLWSSGKAVRPRAFKAAIGSHAPQFTGYEQCVILLADP